MPLDDIFFDALCDELTSKDNPLLNQFEGLIFEVVFQKVYPTGNIALFREEIHDFLGNPSFKDAVASAENHWYSGFDNSIAFR